MRTHVSGIATGLLILVFGAAFAVVGWMGMAEVRPYDDGISTTAAVVGNVEGTVIIDGVVRPDYAPVYEFDTVDGERRRVVDHVTASRRPMEIGSMVEVSYRPDDPAAVRRIDDGRSWLWWFVAGGVPVAVLGALVVLGSLAAMIRSRRPGPVVAA